jgi:CoA:oxalate CoA-transferase
VRYAAEGVIPGPVGSRHATITPFQAFKTKDGNIIIAAGNDGLWVKLTQVLEHAELAENPNYKTNPLRNQHQPQLKIELDHILSAHTTDHWIEVLEKAGIPCGPVNNVAQAVSHPQVAARNMLVTVDDPVTGTFQYAGNPMKFSAFADPETRAPSPDLDADRAKILRELGM